MGFRRHHYKMMYDYGNRLGSGLILSTHLKKLNQELAAQMDLFGTGKILGVQADAEDIPRQTGP